MIKIVLGGLQNIADFLLTPILEPLLSIPPIITIIVISLFISIVSILFQKYFTNQQRLKFLKKEMKKYQAEIKKHKDSPEKQLKINKKMMPLQMEMMRESMKPTLWTMLPFLLLFLWLSAHFAYEPILPGQTFSVSAEIRDAQTVTLEAPQGVTLLSPAEAEVIDGSAEWELTAQAGYYPLTISAGEAIITHPVIVTKQKEYEPPMQTYDGEIKAVEVSNPPLKPLDPFTVFGWRPGWIVVYIVFSLILSISLRKLMDVA